MKENTHICPAERAGALETRFRKLIQDPKKILDGHIKQGTKALEIGCGPGFFTIDMAKMVGESGKVYAADLQPQMLKRIEEKLNGSELHKRVILHQTKEDKIELNAKVDFVFAFYMVHEVPSKQKFFTEIKSLLNEGGTIYIAEPKFHVKKQDFENMIALAQKIGFKEISREKVFFSRGVVLQS